MATQAGVPTVLGDGNTPLVLWAGLTGALGSFTNLSHTPAANPNGTWRQGGVPTVLGDNITPMEQWPGVIGPYTTYVRWRAWGYHYLFSAGAISSYGINGPSDLAALSIDMLPVRGWVFDVPRRNTLIPQAPDSNTRFPGAS